MSEVPLYGCGATRELWSGMIPDPPTTRGEVVFRASGETPSPSPPAR